MSQYEEREEGVPPCKTTLCGGKENQNKAQRSPQLQRPNFEAHKPKPSDMSLKRSQSKESLYTAFKHESELEQAGDQWKTPDFCQLAIDKSTVNRKLRLSDDDRKVTYSWKDDSYPDHPDRFEQCPQLLCSNEVTGRCYWEVEWKGDVSISVSYRGISRRGVGEDCRFGSNHQSWSLSCSEAGRCFFLHNNIQTSVSFKLPIPHRVGVYVDHPAGTLSFYRVSSDKMIHLHTFRTTFTEPLYPGFGFGSRFFYPGTSVSLCSVEKLDQRKVHIKERLRSEKQITSEKS